MTATETMIELSKINPSPQGIQPRDSLDADTVKRYAEMMAENVEFPPISLWDIDGHGVRISNGYHRFAAAKSIGATTIKAVIQVGALSDCIEHAGASNSSNGLQLTTKDRKNGLVALLAQRKAENRHIPTLRHLAEVYGISRETVRRVIAGENGEAPALQSTEIDDSEPETLTQNDKGADKPEQAGQSVSTIPPKDRDDRADMLAAIHDHQQLSNAALQAINKTISCFDDLSLDSTMGMHYIKHAKEIADSIKYLKRVNKMCCPVDICHECNANGCEECVNRGWYAVWQKEING